MSDYPMLISNKLHSFRNFSIQIYNLFWFLKNKPYLCVRTQNGYFKSNR